MLTLYISVGSVDIQANRSTCSKCEKSKCQSLKVFVFQKVLRILSQHVDIVFVSKPVSGIVTRKRLFVCLLVGCLTSQQHASVSQGRICTDNFTCCHTEIEAADPTFYLTQSQYTDTGPTSPSADPLTPGAWQGSHWSANF